MVFHDFSSVFPGFLGSLDVPWFFDWFPGFLWFPLVAFTFLLFLIGFPTFAMFLLLCWFHGFHDSPKLPLAPLLSVLILPWPNLGEKTRVRAPVIRSHVKNPGFLACPWLFLCFALMLFGYSLVFHWFSGLCFVFPSCNTCGRFFFVLMYGWTELRPEISRKPEQNQAKPRKTNKNACALKKNPCSHWNSRCFFCR